MLVASRGDGAKRLVQMQQAWGGAQGSHFKKIFSSNDAAGAWTTLQVPGARGERGGMRREALIIWNLSRGQLLLLQVKAGGWGLHGNHLLL